MGLVPFQSLADFGQEEALMHSVWLGDAPPTLALCPPRETSLVLVAYVPPVQG